MASNLRILINIRTICRNAINSRSQAIGVPALADKILDIIDTEYEGPPEQVLIDHFPLGYENGWTCAGCGAKHGSVQEWARHVFEELE